SAVQAQLAGVAPLEVALSNCPGGPGDSGSLLIDGSGNLLGVAHAGPSAAGNDRDLYHIGVSDVRVFLASVPLVETASKPEVHDPWQIGPNVALSRTPFAGNAPDVLIAGDDHPRQVFVDVDREGRVLEADAASVERIVASRSFPAEIALHFYPDRRVAFYDTDADGTFDLVLVALERSPEAQVRFSRRGGAWEVDTEANVPWLWTGHLTFLDDR